MFILGVKYFVWKKAQITWSTMHWLLVFKTSQLHAKGHVEFENKEKEIVYNK